MARKCRREHFIPKFDKAKAACKRTAGDMKPLCYHLIRLAWDDVKNGRCQRAGSELSKAIRMARRYPGRRRRSY